MAISTHTDSTRDRILAAARAEFSQHGIAGARVDRIAKNAKTSKERVYAYFRSKETLYQTVAAQRLAAVAEATHMDPVDLPGYAGRLHDYFVGHPDDYRLMSWGQLELSGVGPADATSETVRRKLEQLRGAQQAGHLDPSWDPLDVLVFINQLATAWVAQADLLAATNPHERDVALAARRAVVVAAVERLFPPSRILDDQDVRVGRPVGERRDEQRARWS